MASAVKKTLMVVRAMAADTAQHSQIVDSVRVLGMIVRVLQTNEPETLNDAVSILNLIAQNPDYVRECAFEPSLAVELYRVRNDPRVSIEVRRKATMTLQKLQATGEVEWLNSKELNDIADPAETPVVKRRHAPSPAGKLQKPEFTLELEDPAEKVTMTTALMRIRGVLSVFLVEDCSLMRVTCLPSYDADKVKEVCAEHLSKLGVRCFSQDKRQETAAPGTVATPGTPKAKDLEMPGTPSTPYTPFKESRVCKGSPTSPEDQKDGLRKAVNETRRNKGRKRDSIGGVDWCAPAQCDESEAEAEYAAVPEYLDVHKFHSGLYGNIKLHASESTIQARAARVAELRREQQKTADGLLTTVGSWARWVVGA